MRSRLARDPLTGALVIIAPDRAGRPGAFSAQSPLPDAVECPFCPGREHETPPESLAVRPDSPGADTPGWQVRVVPNRYPAVSASGYGMPGAAAGIHEVIIETPAHHERLHELDLKRLAGVLAVYYDRLEYLLGQPGIRRAIIFKNSGAQAGASLSHEHAQAIGLNFVPPELAREERRRAAHARRSGRCLLCDLLAKAISTRRRVVVDMGKAVAICPPAPRFAHETWIIPRDHGPPASDILEAMAACLRKVLGGLESVSPGCAFNLVLAGPERAMSAGHHHLLKVLPRLTGIAGLEWGGGLFVNPVPPAASARLLGR